MGRVIGEADDYVPTSPTRVRAARRFFLGGSCAASEEDDPRFGSDSSVDDSRDMFSSMLAAGVSGASAPRLAGTTGATIGDSAGRGAELVEGVDKGVAILELANGTE